MDKLDFFSKFIPNSWTRMGNTFYVSQKEGASDDNPGTFDSPFRTVGKAASIMEEGSVIEIDEGVYREEINIPFNANPFNPKGFFRFQAKEGKEVYIRGSDVFSPKWKKLSENLFSARLPEKLFSEGAYNPYCLGNFVDVKETVRPIDEKEPLPETLGQIYIDHAPMRQVNGKSALEETENSFLVPADGREILVHPPDGKDISKCSVELTVRAQCFHPNFEGSLLMNVSGIRVEHASELGAFCIGKFNSMRRNGAAGIIVKRDFSLPGASEKACLTVESVDFLPDGKTLAATVIDDTSPSFDIKHYQAVSSDKGLSWEHCGAPSERRYYNFSDPENGRMIRYYWDGKADNHGRCIELGGYFDVAYQVSSDSGRNWGEKKIIDKSRNYAYYYEILKLNDGTLLWQAQENQLKTGMHLAVKTWRGRWNKDLSDVEWECYGHLQCSPDESAYGLSEPHTCQTQEGRLLMLLRQGAILPSQASPGVPSVKLMSMSDDSGKNWSRPRPLTYDDGLYVYSPRSYQDIFRSPVNGRIYAILNICEHPTTGCDPRSAVNIGEIDTGTLCLRRSTVAVVEKVHKEHHGMARYSNWKRVIDPSTGNMLLFMKLHMSEYCQVRDGYDNNTYRYEIIVPK